MKSMITVIKEQIQSFYLIIRLSLFEVKSENNNNYLGMLWELINPGIQIAIYWFVFGAGIRHRGQVDIVKNGHPIDVNFLPWMLAGIAVWFFVQKSITQGSKSVYTRINMVSKMNFPMSVIPSYVIMSKFYSHLLLTAIIFIILQFTGFPVSIYIVQLPYFVFAVLALLISICLVTSTITTIVRDVQNFITATIRMLFYVSAIIWPAQEMNVKIFGVSVATIMKINPFFYIVEGYRSSLLGTSWYFLDHLKYTLYFWVIVFVFLLFGSIMHVKFRNRFVDYL